MEKQEFEIHSYRNPLASGSYYKVFYTDGTTKIFPPYTYPQFAANVTKKCRSFTELRRSSPKTKYIALIKGGTFFDTFNSKAEAKKHAYDSDIKAVDRNGKVIELSEEEKKYFYPQSKLKVAITKMKQPKMNNARLTKMARKGRC